MLLHAWPLFVQIIFFTLINAKAWVFAVNHFSQFIWRGFTNRSKSWIHLRNNVVHYHFFYESTAALIRNRQSKHRSSCFRSGTCRREENFFTRKVWWLSTPSSVLRQPKHWFVFFKSQLKIEVVGPQCAMKTQRMKSETCHSTIWCNWRGNKEKRWTFFGRLKWLIWQEIHQL